MKKDVAYQRRSRKLADRIIWWDAESTDPVISTALNVLSKRYPILQSAKREGVEVRFVKGNDENLCKLVRGYGVYTIVYGRPNMAIRMVGNLIAGFLDSDEEECGFKTFGIMLDCSRNAVMTVEHLKGYLDHIAILGYNMVMLYTEETYRLDDEKFFGFMRGAYTAKEIREIDDYAFSLGMELIPCIQTLGHMEQIFKWGKYADIRDKDGILLVDEEKTYVLIEKMIKFWVENVRSRRIHLGMDEANGLGTGRHQEIYGAESGFSIIARHLDRCKAICDKFGVKPMIWSDMFYRLGSNTGDYYDVNSQPSEDIAKRVPKGLELVYWDYYHDNQAFYENHIEKHRAIAGDPLMGSGIWTWCIFWYNHFSTRRNVTPCIAACKAKQLKEVFLTIWGDQGGFCDMDSAMAGLAFSAELSFRGEADEKRLEQIFKRLFDGASYKAITALGEASSYTTGRLLFDDPLMLIFTKSFVIHKEGDWTDPIHGGDFKDHQKKLAAAAKVLKTAKEGSAGHMAYAKAVAKALITKLDYAEAAFKVAKNVDHRSGAPALLKFARKYFAAVSELENELWLVWRDNNKPFGLESIQIRMAGVVARAHELVIRLEDFIDSDEKSIPEFLELRRMGNDLSISSYGGFTDVALGTSVF